MGNLGDSMWQLCQVHVEERCKNAYQNSARAGRALQDAVRAATGEAEDMPLACVDDAVVWHRAGTSIGSGSPGQGASPMSHYFLHRGRMRFVRRVCPQNLPFAFAYTCYRLLRLLPKRSWAEFDALARGGLGLPPPRAVRERLSPEAQDHAFGRRG